MNGKKITIEEIINNPNLDLTERIIYFSQNNKWSSEDLRELAIASIKQEYEFWIKRRENISPRTDELLKQILNGHILTKTEELEMVCSDQKMVEHYKLYEDLKQRISNNNVISYDDLYELCYEMGLDDKTTELMRLFFEQKGLAVPSYEEKGSFHR